MTSGINELDAQYEVEYVWSDLRSFDEVVKEDKRVGVIVFELLLLFVFIVQSIYNEIMITAAITSKMIPIISEWTLLLKKIELEKIINSPITIITATITKQTETETRINLDSSSDSMNLLLNIYDVE